MPINNYQIQEKASSAYIMSAFRKDRGDINDLKFYMDVAYQMSATLVTKCSNENLEDSSYSGAITATIHAAQIIVTQLGITSKEDEEAEVFKDYIEKLEYRFRDIYKGKQVLDKDKAETILLCQKVQELIIKKIAVFGIKFERNTTATID